MRSKQVINPELLNAPVHEAKHVLSFATLRKYRHPSDPSRSLIISPVPQPMSSTAELALFAKTWRKGETTRRPIPRTPITSKVVARHLNLPNHSLDEIMDLIF